MSNTEMTEISEINIEELKAQIRNAVTRREAEGGASFIKASAELLEFLSKDDPLLELMPDGLGSEGRPRQKQLALQPEFVRSPDDRYHVNDLLRYHDHHFVWNAYVALLKREPDEEGLTGFLKKLRSGRFNKIDILASLHYSPEGKRQKVTVEGLWFKAVLRLSYRVPILGYLVELLVALVRLPGQIRHQRQLETYLVGQQQLMSDYVNEMNQAGVLEQRRLQDEIGKVRDELRESFSRAVADLRREQKQIARLQQQQLAAFFRGQRVARPSDDNSEKKNVAGSPLP